MQRQKNLGWRLTAVVLVLWGGFALRIIDTGTAPLQGDEVWTAHLAYDFGHNGHRNELGVVSSTGLNQSPFFGDLFALPFALSPDAEVARLWMAELQLLGMATLYMLVRRFWSTKTAFAALLIFATMPNAVWAGRYLWNPYLTLPFMIGFYACGWLMTRGNRWARWLHPLMLACATQAHPAAIGNVPLAVGFYAADFARTFDKNERRLRGRAMRRYWLDHIGGACLAAVSLLPWLVGILRRRAQQSSPGPLLDWTASSDLSRILRFAYETPMRLDTGAFGLPVEATPYRAEWRALLYERFGQWILILSVVLVVWGVIQLVRRSRYGYPTLMAGAAYLIFPLMLAVLPSDTYDFYLTILVPAAALVLAVALLGPARPAVLTALGGVVVILVVGMQLDWSLTGLRAVRTFDQFSRESTLGWRDMVSLRDEAVRPGYETIYLVEGASGDDFEQALLWEMLATRGESRVIWGTTTTLPVPFAGATYVGYEGAVHIPELYAEPAPRLVAGNTYRVVDLPPDQQFTPRCEMTGPARLDNGVVMLGYTTPGAVLPEAGKPWTIYMLWQVEQLSPDGEGETYQLFVHLIGPDETRYAQQDIEVLYSPLWRLDEQMVSRVTLMMPDDLPPVDGLALRIGMYTLPAIVNAAVLDADGNPVGSWMIIPVCEGE